MKIPPVIIIFTAIWLISSLVSFILGLQLGKDAEHNKIALTHNLKKHAYRYTVANTQGQKYFTCKEPIISVQGLEFRLDTIK